MVEPLLPAQPEDTVVHLPSAMQPPSGAVGDTLGPNCSRPVPASLGKRPQEESSVLKLKGLPYTATEQQILSFFEGFNLVRVAFVYEPDGRPSGLVSQLL